MQYYYDKCLPGNSTILNEYDAVTMQIRENSLNVKDCVLDMSKSVPLPRESETTLKPVIGLLLKNLENLDCWKIWSR